MKVDDALLFVDDAQRILGEKGLDGVPLFIGGDSLGGLVSSFVVVHRQELFAGHVMQSPLRRPMAI